MAFALSSLLNHADMDAEPSEEQQEATQQSPSASPVQGHEPLSLRSPDLLHSQLPKYTPPQRPRPSSSNAAEAGGLSSSARSEGVQGNEGDHETMESSVGRTERTLTTSLASHTMRTNVSPSLEHSDPALTSSFQGRSSIQQETDVSQIDAQLDGAGGDGVLETLSRAEDTRTAPPSAQRNTVGSEAEYDEDGSVTIKQEAEPSPRGAPPINTHRLSIHTAEIDQSANRSLNSLKQEHASRTQSPLRESSIAPSFADDQSSVAGANMKKRAAPSKSKKGTASTAKKPRAPTKKRKTDKAKPATGKSGSGKGTPATFSPAPSDARSFSPDVDDEDDDESAADSNDDVEGSGDVYCICRKPDNGTFMIGCDGQCDDWFHGKCVGIEERDKNLMDKYICPTCRQSGVGRTSWKRMCRRLGCRQPARVGRNAHKDGTTSKYCSDECGVLFFREMTARARGKEQSKKSRRKPGVADELSLAPNDAHARGGTLSAGEVKALLDLSNTATEFKAFGNGVLSPPTTPTKDDAQSSGFTQEEDEKLKDIQAKKDEARLRHRSLKDRLLFVGYVKAEATRAATAKDLKPKDYCGFDPRVVWSEEEFTEWRQSPQGQSTFERGSLEPLTNGVLEPTTEADAAEDEHLEACSRKKCARHLDWSKLAVDEIRFEMTDNSDHMRSLEQQEEEIKLQALMRAKHSTPHGEGSVEWHQDKPVSISLDEQTAEGVPSPLEHDPMQIDQVSSA